MNDRPGGKGGRPHNPSEQWNGDDCCTEIHFKNQETFL
ncbi:hypothetical protein J2Z66_003182 [Paenibacillus eucommiae]|uniref:Uncharacterized protein n=1 Tax=Paenibacillus eucommiae TaxID=1355755 RepID=A0ABS4IVG9_9BACL|nr:hypothetical protein [Paenibacillus eucommiae]